MHNICFAVYYIDFLMFNNLTNRINEVRKFSGSQVHLLCYEGSYMLATEEFCKINDIKLIRISKEEFSTNITIQNKPFLVSLATYNKLKEQNFNEINFVDYYGIGYHCIQAKRMGMDFNSTTLNVQMFGSSQFQNESAEEWGNGGFEQLMIQYMERYGCEFCDRLISPTISLINWALERKWRLSNNKEVRYFSPIDNKLQIEYECNIANKCLIYCGQLGKSGGLHLFINALKRMAIQGKNKSIKKVMFVGEYKFLDYMPANEFIEKNLSKDDYTWEILGANTTDRLIEIANENNAILIFPSYMGIIGQDVISASQCNIKMVVSDNAAHREIFESGSLFETSPSGLMNAIVQNKFAVIKNNIKDCYLNDRCAEYYMNKDIIDKEKDLPLVTIITAYYNHGKFIEMARKSIENQDYPNIEWILIDDGSTDKDSINKLDEYRKKYNNKPYKILRKDNEGPSIARNYGASYAKGELLIFMDSDNVAKPNMVSNFVKAIIESGCDCLTCYFDQFTGEGEVNSKSLNGITYALLGPSLETGVFNNCFGDTNFIVKKPVFNEIGGFLAQRVVTEDWHILSKIALKGYSIDVIPKPLFWYRVLPESNVSYGSEYYKQQIILRTYCEDLPPYVYHILNSLCRPTLSVKESLRLTRTGALYIKLTNIADKVFPNGSKRRHVLKSIIDKIV